jgi:hypothetical protein
MEEAFEEGQGPHTAVESVMMMMMVVVVVTVSHTGQGSGLYAKNQSTPLPRLYDPF